jgi:hypothetical protein
MCTSFEVLAVNKGDIGASPLSSGLISHQHHHIRRGKAVHGIAATRGCLLQEILMQKPFSRVQVGVQCADTITAVLQPAVLTVCVLTTVETAHGFACQP